MINEDNDQRELSWRRVRIGKITGSKVADIMKSGRKKDEVFPRQPKRICIKLLANVFSIPHS